MEYTKEFNSLPPEEQVKQLKKTLEWYSDFADSVQGDHRAYEYACEHADEKEAERNPKDLSGCYSSICDFIEENELEEKVNEVFGEDWEPENDVEQVKELANSIGSYTVGTIEENTERDSRADDYIKVAKD